MAGELGAVLFCPVIDPPAVNLVTQWVVCPHDHLRHAKVHAFVDWVKKERDAWVTESTRTTRLKRTQAN